MRWKGLDQNDVCIIVNAVQDVLFIGTILVNKILSGDAVKFVSVCNATTFVLEKKSSRINTFNMRILVVN